MATPLPAGAQQALVRDIVAIADDDVWAVGGWSGVVNGQYQTFALAMHWDGTSWTLADLPQPAPCSVCHNVTLWAVDAAAPDDVWAAGHKNVQAPDGFVGTHILVMHYDGHQWMVMDTPIQSGASGDILWDVRVMGPSNVWFFGENIYAPYPLMLQLAIALRWDGSSFTFAQVPIVNFQSSGFGNGNSLHAGAALGANEMWAVGAGGDGDSLSCNLSQIHRWNGSQWQHVPAQAPDGCYWHDLDAVAAIAPDDVWAGGNYFDGTYHGLALHWDGQSWTQVAAPGSISDLHAFASDDVYAAGASIMHWDGSNWSVVQTFPQVNGASFAGLSAAGPCRLWAGGRQIGPSGNLIPLVVRQLPSPPVPGDINADGVVNVADLLAVINAWGACGAPCPADANGDGMVNVADMLVVINNWG